MKKGQFISFNGPDRWYEVIPNCKAGGEMRTKDRTDAMYQLLEAMKECTSIFGIITLVHARDYLRDTYILKIGQ